MKKKIGEKITTYLLFLNFKNFSFISNAMCLSSITQFSKNN